MCVCMYVCERVSRYGRAHTCDGFTECRSGRDGGKEGRSGRDGGTEGIKVDGREEEGENDMCSGVKLTEMRG